VTAAALEVLPDMGFRHCIDHGDAATIPTKTRFESSSHRSSYTAWSYNATEVVLNKSYRKDSAEREKT
jgi:hypothetical protein